MTITNPNVYLSDESPSWVHHTFVVKLGDSFESYQKIVQYQNSSEQFSSGGTTVAVDPTVQQVMTTVGDNQPSPVYVTERKCRDTSLGGIEVMNPYYQYNELDDIYHEFTFADNTKTSGLGRVYSETIYDNQQVMYLTFGIPLFNNLASFYTNVVSTPLVDLMNRGPEFVNASMIGRLAAKVTQAAGLLVELPVMSLMYINKMQNNIENSRVTKYYDFKGQMPLYWRFVQGILNNITTNMGFMDDARALNGYSPTGSHTTSTSYSEEFQSNGASTNGNSGLNAAMTFDFLGKYQMNILGIMAKYYKYENNDTSNIDQRTADDALDPIWGSRLGQDGEATTTDTINGSATGESFIKWTSQLLYGFAQSYNAALHDACFFVGFKVEKGVDTSESLSNQSGPSDVQNAINSKLASARSSMFSFGNSLAGGVVGQMLGSIKGMLATISSQNSVFMGLSDLTALATGSGQIDIPEMWENSSFSKNYSFRMQLRSPYGDPLSIIMSEYVPLACLLAGALPRAVGSNSYTSPFIVRAYCKGMFAVPLGMIDNITIARGGDVHGWNMSRLPTAIDVSFTIKDLCPAMLMALGDSGGVLDAVMGENSVFQEYLATLSGLGIKERLDFKITQARKMQIYGRNLITTSRLSPELLGMTMGAKSAVRLLVGILPNTAIFSNIAGSAAPN